MKGNEYPSKKYLVLFFQRKGKTIDYTIVCWDWFSEMKNQKTLQLPSKNLKQLCYSIVTLRLIDKLEKYIVDGSSDKGSKIQEFSIDSVQSGFQEISFPRIFAIK